MKRNLLYLCIFISNYAVGALPPLVQEFLESNIDLKSKSEDVLLATLRYNTISSQKTLQFNLSGSYDDNKLDTSSTMNLSSSKNRVYVLGISKSFFSGTTLSLSNSLLNIDRSSVNPAWLGSSPIVINEFSQELTLSQKLGKNFAGREDRIALEKEVLNINLEELKLKDFTDQKVKEFYISYLNLVQNLENLSFQGRAYVRSKKRTKLVKRKWKDGLAEKVEVLQAHNAQMTQKEQLETIKIAVSRASRNLAQYLHRKVKNHEVILVDLNNMKLPTLPTGSLKSSLMYQKLVKGYELTEQGVQSVSYKMLPEIDLSASYKSNSYDHDKTTALTHGYLGKGDHEFKVMINLTTQWGFATANNELSIEKVKRRKAQYALANYKNNFVFMENHLKTEARLLKLNFSMAKERLSISKRVLKEYTRLYRVGKSDLDQLIRAEESLINTEKSLLNYYILYENQLLNLASLYGKTIEYLTKRTFDVGATVEKYH